MLFRVRTRGGGAVDVAKRQSDCTSPCCRSTSPRGTDGVHADSLVRTSKRGALIIETYGDAAGVLESCRQSRVVCRVANQTNLAGGLSVYEASTIQLARPYRGSNVTVGINAPAIRNGVTQQETRGRAVLVEIDGNASLLLIALTAKAAAACSSSADEAGLGRVGQETAVDEWMNIRLNRDPVGDDCGDLDAAVVCRAPRRSKSEEVYLRLREAKTKRCVASNLGADQFVFAIGHGASFRPHHRERQSDHARSPSEASAVNRAYQRSGDTIGCLWVVWQARRCQHMTATIASDLHHAHESVTELDADRSAARSERVRHRLGQPLQATAGGVVGRR